jgi:hypothetical protein
MRAMLLVVIGFLPPGLIQAQERWQRLPGAASSYHVDLQSLTPTYGVLRARIQRSDLGNLVVVQELEVRCATQESRTLARSEYDNDTGKPIPTSASQEPDTLWISYPPGSEGHAIVAGLCALGRERKLLGNAARLDV